jgi:hypothetical protein
MEDCNGISEFNLSYSIGHLPEFPWFPKDFVWFFGRVGGGGAVATMFFTLDRYTVRAKQLIPYCVIA